MKLLEYFFGLANQLLKPGGQIVVTHKTIEPFSLWDIPGIAMRNGYELLVTHPFDVD